jgi:hypothetical protein
MENGLELLATEARFVILYVSGQKKDRFCGGLHPSFFSVHPSLSGEENNSGSPKSEPPVTRTLAVAFLTNKCVRS